MPCRRALRGGSRGAKFCHRSDNCYGNGTGASGQRLSLEESGRRFSFGVSLLLVESPADLGTPVLLRLGDGFNGCSSIRACIDYFGVPIAAKVGSKKLKWLLQKLPRRVGARLQVVGSSLAGGSDHQH